MSQLARHQQAQQWADQADEHLYWMDGSDKDVFMESVLWPFLQEQAMNVLAQNIAQALGYELDDIEHLGVCLCIIAKETREEWGDDD